MIKFLEKLETIDDKVPEKNKDDDEIIKGLWTRDQLKVIIQDRPKM